MRRPAVLHCVRQWAVPSETFVVDFIRSTSATRPFVACGHRVQPLEDPCTVWEIDRAVGRVPARLQYRARVAALTGAALRSRADVLHAHFGQWAPAVARAARMLGRPWVVSLHGRDLLVEAPPLADVPLVATAARVIVPSRFLARAAVDYGFDPSQVRVIPSGADLARMPFRVRKPGADGTIVVTFVGRFVEKKGPIEAVLALAEVQRTYPKLRARFVGYGPLETEIKRLIHDTGLRAEILDGAEVGAVADALAATDLVLTPSRTAADGDAETLSVVNLEAQACGIPVLTTDHGGVPEAVTSSSAIVVPEGSVTSMVAGLSDLVAHPERWAAMGEAGRRNVALNFELGARTAEVEDEYRAVLGIGGPTTAGTRPARDEWPRVSVVIPAFNRRDLLSHTIDELEAQTYPSDRLEVVVVDNGSSDGTSEMLASRQPPWPLRVLRNDANRSAAAARDQGIAVASGEVVAFTDSDCRPRSTWLETLVAGFDDGIGIVQGRTSPDPRQSSSALSRSQSVPFEYGLYETCNIAYRRSVLDAVDAPPFRETIPQAMRALLGAGLAPHAFGEDVDLALRAKRLGNRSRFASHAVVYHHVFPPNLRYLLERSALVAGFPLLASHFPEIRDGFLWRRFFLSPRRPLITMAVAAVALTALDRRFIVGTAPYLLTLTQPWHRGVHRRWREISVRAACDAVETVSLAYGSARTHAVVL